MSIEPPEKCPGAEAAPTGFGGTAKGKKMGSVQTWELECVYCGQPFISSSRYKVPWHARPKPPPADDETTSQGRAMTFSDAVRAARKSKLMSQRQVADECGWSRSKQSHIETGRYDKPITTDDRARLGRALGCEFVSEDDGTTWEARPAS
jgi:DNA-binding XRE family transcriptional regulator